MNRGKNNNGGDISILGRVRVSTAIKFYYYQIVETTDITDITDITVIATTTTTTTIITYILFYTRKQK